MLCPHCNSEIPDGTAICTVCDAILDSGFLDASTQPGADTDGVPLVPPSAPAPPQSAPIVPPAQAPPTAQASAPTPAPASPAIGSDLSGHTDGTSILQMDPEVHKETRIVNVADIKSSRSSQGPSAGRARGGAALDDDSGLDDFWGQVLLAYRRLRPLEKVTMYCLAGLFVTAFLPWFTVKGQGFASGIEGQGAYAAGAAFLAMVVFWVRVSMRIVLLVLLQVAFVVAAGLVAGWALRTTTAGTAPSFGIYLTLLAGAGAAVMSLVAAVKS